MQQCDLPSGVRSSQLPAGPRQLVRVEIRAVEREHLDIGRQAREQVRGRPERVVPLAAHIEAGIEPLPRVVVVAQHRIELDAVIEEDAVRLFELDAVVPGRCGPLVDVVAGHQNEGEGKAGAVFHHARRHLELRPPAPPAVTDDRELHRRAPTRQRENARLVAYGQFPNADALFPRLGCGAPDQQSNRDEPQTRPAEQ